MVRVADAAAGVWEAAISWQEASLRNSEDKRSLPDAGSGQVSKSGCSAHVVGPACRHPSRPR